MQASEHIAPCEGTPRILRMGPKPQRDSQRARIGTAVAAGDSSDTPHSTCCHTHPRGPLERRPRPIPRLQTIFPSTGHQADAPVHWLRLSVSARPQTTYRSICLWALAASVPAQERDAQPVVAVVVSEPGWEGDPYPATSLEPSVPPQGRDPYPVAALHIPPPGQPQ